MRAKKTRGAVVKPNGNTLSSLSSLGRVTCTLIIRWPGGVLHSHRRAKGSTHIAESGTHMVGRSTALKWPDGVLARLHSCRRLICSIYMARRSVALIWSGGVRNAHIKAEGCTHMAKQSMAHSYLGEVQHLHGWAEYLTQMAWRSAVLT